MCQKTLWEHLYLRLLRSLNYYLNPSDLLYWPGLDALHHINNFVASWRGWSYRPFVPSLLWESCPQTRPISSGWLDIRDYRVLILFCVILILYSLLVVGWMYARRELRQRH